MRKVVVSFGVLFLFIFCSLNLAVAQDDQYEILKKIDKAYYNPIEKGLKDLSLELGNSMWKMNPMMKNMKIMFYWKKGTPHKSKWDVTGLPDMMKGRKDQFVKGFEKFGEFIVGNSWETQAKKYKWKVKTSDDGNLKKIELKSTSEKFKAQDQTVWIDGNYKVVKMEATQKNPMTGQTITVKTTIKNTKKGGKYLLEKMTMDMGNMKQEIKFSYKKVKNIWIVCKMDFQQGGMPVSFDMTNIKVNEGIDDSKFKESEKKDDSAKKKKGGGAF